MRCGEIMWWLRCLDDEAENWRKRLECVVEVCAQSISFERLGKANRESRQGRVALRHPSAEACVFT